MRQLHEWGWSYGAVARAIGANKSTLHQMVTDPNYQPFFDLGQKFRRFYIRVARTHRAAERSSQ